MFAPNKGSLQKPHVGTLLHWGAQGGDKPTWKQSPWTRHLLSPADGLVNFKYLIFVLQNPVKDVQGVKKNGEYLN